MQQERSHNYIILACYPASLGRKGGEVREGGRELGREGQAGGEGGRPGMEGKEGGREGGARANLGFPPSLQPYLTASYTL